MVGGGQLNAAGTRLSWGPRIALVTLLVCLMVAVGACGADAPAPVDEEATRAAVRAEVEATVRAEAAAATVAPTATEVSATATVQPTVAAISEPAAASTGEPAAAETPQESSGVEKLPDEEIPVFLATWTSGTCRIVLEEATGNKAPLDLASRIVVSMLASVLPEAISELPSAIRQEETVQGIVASAIALAPIVEEWTEDALGDDRRAELEALCSELDVQFDSAVTLGLESGVTGDAVERIGREFEEWYAGLTREQEASPEPSVSPELTAIVTPVPPAVEVLEHGCITVDDRLVCFAKLLNPSLEFVRGWTEVVIHVFDQDDVSFKGLSEYLQVLFPGEVRGVIETASMPEGTVYGSTLVDVGRSSPVEKDIALGAYPFTVDEPLYEPGQRRGTVTCVVGNESDKTIDDASVEVMLFDLEGRFVGGGEGFLPVLIPGGKARAQVDVSVVPESQPARIEVYPAITSITTVR